MLRTIRWTAVSAMLASAAFVPPIHAQNTTSVAPARGLPTTINVFLDCNSCDFDYLRTEIAYVNWVRDRTDADVHLLIISQGTGGGGSEYSLAFLGQRGFAGSSDSLKYVSTVNATSDDRRKGLAQTIKVGLVRYVARTSSADRLIITFGSEAESSRPKAEPQRDPWHAWVFSLSANGNTDGDKNYSSFNGRFYSDANRTTAAFKSSIGGNFSYNQNDIVVDSANAAGTGETTFTTIRRNWSGYTSQIKSLTEHWSAGFTGSFGSNSYSNQKLYVRSNLAVEYDLFPYKESTRRQLRIQYGAGFAHYRYEDTTIYFRIRETVPTHYLSASFSARQPWGSANIDLSRNALIREPSKRSTDLYLNANVRIIKGLSVNFGGGYNWIHNQLYLKNEGASQLNVLLRQQQLLTSYSYWAYGGLSYTFGSIFNNVVNPRFGGGGGD